MHPAAGTQLPSCFMLQYEGLWGLIPLRSGCTFARVHICSHRKHALYRKSYGEEQILTFPCFACYTGGCFWAARLEVKQLSIQSEEYTWGESGETGWLSFVFLMFKTTLYKGESYRSVTAAPDCLNLYNSSCLENSKCFKNYLWCRRVNFKTQNKCTY